MRATGFFYTTGTENYLITARHNALPTKATILSPFTGGKYYSITTNDFLPVIDIYLRRKDEWFHHRLDLRDMPNGHVITIPKLDLLAIRIPFDPTTFQYSVFTGQDVTLPSEEENTLSGYGFGGGAFSDEEECHDVTDPGSYISNPMEITLENTAIHVPEKAKQFEPVFGISCDPTPEIDSIYNGMSGSPIIGDGLVGVWSGTARVPSVDDPKHETYLRVHYFGVELLKRAFNS